MNFKRNLTLLTWILFFCTSFTGAAENLSVSCEDLRNSQIAGKAPTILDVRSAAAYQRAHIEGALSAPYEKLDKVNFPKDQPLVAHCSGVGCSLSNDAAIILTRMGYKDVRVLLGGISEWEMKGYPVVRAARPKVPVGVELLKGKEVPASEARKFLGRIQVLDVRPPTEFQAGHIPGALNVPLEKLAEGVDQLAGEVLVVDRVPARWKKAVEILTQEGRFAHAVAGGMAVWTASGHPLEVGGR